MMEFYQNTGAATFGLLVFHVIVAVALWKMAERTKEEPRWFALVPFLNIALFLKIAKKPLWWLLLFLVPLVNVITLVVATMGLCERFGVNKWWALVSIISPFNLILYLYLAYGTEKSPAAPSTPSTPQTPPAAPQS